MEHSIFAMEVCLPLDAGLHTRLRESVVNHPLAVGYQQKWALYRQAAEEVIAFLDHVHRGCWDYFDSNARALQDYDMWVKGMTTEEGARTDPSGRGDPYRGRPRYMTLTMAFLMVQGSPTDRAMASLCNVQEDHLWKRATFAHLLRNMGVVNFASVKSDVIYVIPGNDEWGLTMEDLVLQKFEYLRNVT